MPMNPNFLCCIGAELKNSTQQTTRMTQVYLYRAFEDDTLSDMLSAGFFDEAIGILRQDDLLLLYSPNETVAKWTYARVSNVDRDGVTVAQIGIDATAVSVNTTGYSNISGNNLQEIIDSIDSEFSKYVKLDGTSIMTGPLKIRAGSMQGAIAAYWDGVGFFKLNSNDSVTLLASMEATDGLCPATNNTYNIGKASHKWKDAHIARVITAIINNGYDIAVPVTNGPDTLALKSEVDTAANSGRMITDQGVWFAKMYAATIPPAADDGTNYADFSQTDGDGNPIIVIYERQSGAWVQSQTVTPPANYDGYVPVTKKIWDIVEQTGQNGGRILWNHQSKEFTPYPNIVDLSNVATTDLDNLTPTGEAKFTAKANTDMDNLTDTGKNIGNWSSNVSNCITEIPQDIKLELNNGTLTLKAGSKVYVPNGAGVFNEITTASDLTTTAGSDGVMFVFIRQDGTLLFGEYNQESGTGTPANIWTTYYNTNDNKVYRYTTSTTTPSYQASLPIAKITVSGGAITSIDQIFNGFGYIGSTVFALPGVKGLIPNGRNADGTLKNTEFVFNSVITSTDTSNYTDIIYLVSDGTDINRRLYESYGYDRYKNIVTNNGIQENQACIGLCYRQSGKVSKLYSKPVFHSLDRSETDFIAHQAMPSNKYIELTLGVSGTRYDAPADGWFVASSEGVITMALQGNRSGITVNGAAGFAPWATLPVSKGAYVLFSYSSNQNNKIRFYYAEGANY